MQKLFLLLTSLLMSQNVFAQSCPDFTFSGTPPIAPTASTAGVGGTGTIQTYTIPAGVTSIRIDARGAKGGNTDFNGGNGGRVQATYAVSPGDVLYILVGGKGGDGAADNGMDHRSAAGGGGATVISKGAIGTGTLLLVAGGGGGAGDHGGGGESNNFPGSGNGYIGAGGGSFSADGGTSFLDNTCGKGGIASTNGGNGGANTCFKPETNGGGFGGGGAGNNEPGRNNAGGGGGGGYVGGNAGGVSGGNGGSSYTEPSATNVVIGNHTDDNGSVAIYAVAGTQNMTWNGSVNTSWNNYCNWTPKGLPTTTNQVIINDVTNDPFILTGTTATAKEIYINTNGSLSVNSGGTLNINVTTVPVNITFQGNGSSLTNDGTIRVGTGNGFGFAANNVASITNRGTINTNNDNGVVAIDSGNFTFINESTGVVNSNFRNTGVASLNVTNRGKITVNDLHSGYAFDFEGMSSLVNEGTIQIASTDGISNRTGATVTNRACGKIIMSTGDYINSGTTTNTGLIQIANGLLNTGGTFTNNGVLKYGSLSGNAIINNQNSSVIVNNSIPIFTYGGLYNGTINGIFTNSTATLSAGAFIAPNMFTPSVTGTQLYAKITPIGGACSYVIPFGYSALPEVSLTAISGKKLGEATLNGTINPMFLTVTSAQFEVSTDAMFSTKNILSVPVGALGSGNRPVAVQALLTDMLLNRVYYYRLRATNENGTVISVVGTVSRDNELPVFLSKDVAAGEDCAPFNHEVLAFDYDTDESPVISLVSAPSWITFSQENGKSYLTANPTQQQTGVFPVVVQVKSDADVVSQTITITIQDLNHAPVFTSEAPSLGTIMRKGQSHSFTFSATDCDGDAVTLSPASFPAWFMATSNTATSNTATASFTGIPQEEGKFMIKMVATDGKAEASQAYSLQTTAQYIPLIVSTPPVAVEAAKSFVYDLKAESDDGDLMIFVVEQAPEWLKLVCDGAQKWQCKSTSKAQLIGAPSAQDLAQNVSVKIMILDDTPYSNLRSCQVFTFGTENGKSVVKDLKQTNCGTESLKENEGTEAATLKLSAPLITSVVMDNYPNPFNPSTNFTLALPTDQHVQISVYDLTGRKVATLHKGTLAGQITHTFAFNGSQLASGKYLVRVQGDDFANTKLITLMK
jgi:hypothetical protein